MSQTEIIDIIILSYAKNDTLKSLTEQTIGSLIVSEAPPKIQFNIVVVESEKKLSPYQFEYTKTIYPKSKFGFNAYLNIGLKNTSNRYVCLCNNDLIFHANWATEILNAFNNDDELLSTSPICPRFHPGHGYQVNTGERIGYGVGREVAGWCIFLKRQVLEKIGTLDPKIIFWYADNDYSNLLQKHGIKHALVTSSIVEHMVESTKLSEDQLNQNLYTKGSFIYYDYKWNHKNFALYIFRKASFAIADRLRRLKRTVKRLNSR